MPPFPLIRRLNPLRGSRTALPAVIGLLTVILLGVGLLDYLRVRRLTLRLASDQAQVLVRHVERSTARAALAEQYVKDALSDQLFAVSNLLEELTTGGSAGIDWSGLARRAEVDRLDLFDAEGRWRAGNRGPGRLDEDFQGAGAPDSLTRAGGLFTDSLSGQRYFGVVRRLPRGQRLRVAVDSRQLLAIRRTVGISALLEDLASHPEVRYATLDSREQLIAATPRLPDWVERPGDPEHDQALEVTAFETVTLDSPEGAIFEARTPFGSQPGVVLRLGIVNPGLRQILARARWAIGLRTLLVLALAGVLLAFILSRQSVRLLSGEKRRIEGEVRRLEAERSLRERLAAMGSLAGGVAHEIRNPLNTIAMAAQRLEFQLDPVRHAQLYGEIVQSIRREAQRIERIVGDFLQFARPPAINRQPQDSAAVLQQVVETFASLAQSRGVEFRAELAELPPLRLDADAFRQAVLNLLLNALQALPETGGRVILASGTREGWAWFSVADNGPGVPEEQRRKIFDLYYTTRASGTGLGLPLVQRCAAQHDGHVDVSDTPGGGATFTFFLEIPA
ncbi:MAG: HAMP domain-containing sensor histidine kinase [Candidatus Delongbacteria bacterium]